MAPVLAPVRTWAATCPRCKTRNQSEPLKCGNCDSHDVRLESGYGGLRAECRACRQGVPVKTACAGCGAELGALAGANVANRSVLKVVFWCVAAPMGLFLLVVSLA